MNNTIGIANRPLQVNLKSAVFYLCYLLLFVVGGFINYYGILPFKMAYVSFLPFMLLPFSKVRVDSMLIMAIIFALIILLSGLINSTPFSRIILYLQQAVAPFMIYYLVTSYLNEKNIHKVFRLSLFLSLIQLPLVILQQLFYDQLSKYGIRDVLREDFAAGTFYTSNDPALAFFIFGVILFLSFDTRRNYIVKRKGLILIWLSITVFAIHSKISILVLLMIYCSYLLARIKLKLVVSFFLLAILVTGILWVTGLFKQVGTNIGYFFYHLSQFNVDHDQAKKHFTEGLGNRIYALNYLFTESLYLMGQGPFASFNPDTKEYNLGGDSGHLINTYINLGITGIIISYLYLLSFLNKKIISRFVISYFIVMCVFSLTVDIFTDPSFMMAFHLFASSYLLHPKTTISA